MRGSDIDVDRVSATMVINAWAAVPEGTQRRVGMPPFPPGRLGNWLAHLAELVTA